MEKFERYFSIKNGGQITVYTPIFDLKAAIEVIMLKVNFWLQKQEYLLQKWINATPVGLFRHIAQLHDKWTAV